MLKVKNENTCGKIYDPIDFNEDTIFSYAFDLKDGGRQHPLSDYQNIEEICELMITETADFLNNY